MKILFKIVLAITAVCVIFSLLFSLVQIQGNLMSPSIPNGKYALFWKPNTYKLSRGIVVTHDDGFVLEVGRIIGLPSEQIRIKNNVIYINNTDGLFKLEEEYLNNRELGGQSDTEEWYKVPNNSYLILMDSQPGINFPLNTVDKDNIKGILLWKF